MDGKERREGKKKAVSVSASSTLGNNAPRSQTRAANSRVKEEEERGKGEREKTGEVKGAAT